MGRLFRSFVDGLPAAEWRSVSALAQKSVALWVLPSCLLDLWAELAASKEGQRATGRRSQGHVDARECLCLKTGRQHQESSSEIRRHTTFEPGSLEGLLSMSLHLQRHPVSDISGFLRQH